MQPLGTIESVKKVQVITHVETTDPSVAEEKDTLVVEVTKEETCMKECHCTLPPCR